MSETIPIIIGVALTIVLVRWIYNNRNPDQTDSGLSRANLEQLSSMFPNVPNSVLRSELVRGGGSINAAIERLLIVSSRYPTNSPQVSRPTTSATPTGTSTASATAENLQQPLTKPTTNDNDNDPPIVPLKVDADTWLRDQNVREKLLSQKKQEMIQRARRRYLEKERERV